MLVLLGPSFNGTPESFEKLAQLTGLVAYDLRSRVRPGCWGVVRAVGDSEQAQALGILLRREGFPVVLVDREAAWHPERHFVPVDSLSLEPEQIVLRIREQRIPVSHQAILALVRGDVGLARASSRPLSVSSSTWKAVAPTAADVQVFRENSVRQAESYPALDIHFITVRWVGRIDARTFDFSVLERPTGSPVRDLDALVEALAERSGVRVDKSSRMSSIASLAAPPHRSLTPLPGSRVGRVEGPIDERFDNYSRVIGEAELQALSQLGVVE